jgi:hypothetical protein
MVESLVTSLNSVDKEKGEITSPKRISQKHMAG